MEPWGDATLGGVRKRTEKQRPPAESRLARPWFPPRPWWKGGEKESLLLQTVQEFLIASPPGDPSPHP